MGTDNAKRGTMPAFINCQNFFAASFIVHTLLFVKLLTMNITNFGGNCNPGELRLM